MYRVYSDISSGNCYKVKLLMHLLGIEHEWVHVDILGGETHSDDFLSMNPAGKIPTVQLPRGDYLFESNAILHYLATDTDYLPADTLDLARVLQWQFFEQYSHEPGVAVARFIRKYLNLPPERKTDYDAALRKGHQALTVMETHLSSQEYFVANRFTIADISLYACTHVAPEGGFDLQPYPAISAWLERIEARPQHLSMAGFSKH
jgi:glutathione S-transferase